MTARDISLPMAVGEDQNGIPTDQSNENGPVEGENPMKREVTLGKRSSPSRFNFTLSNNIWNTTG